MSICGRAVASVQPSRWWPPAPSSGSGGTPCSVSTFSTQSRCSWLIISSSWPSRSSAFTPSGSCDLGRHDEVDAVGLAVDVLVDPLQLDLELLGREVQGAEDAHPAGPADRGDDVAAVAEGEDREFQAEVAGELCAHRPIVGSRGPHLQHVLGSRYGPAGARTARGDDRNPSRRDRRAQGAAPRGRDGARGRGRLRRGADARRRGPGRGRARARCTGTTRRRTNCCSRRWRNRPRRCASGSCSVRRRGDTPAAARLRRVEARVARARALRRSSPRRCSPRCRRRRTATRAR